MKCKFCGGELYGGKGDYWHIMSGAPDSWPMRCPDGKHLGLPEDEEETSQ